MTMVFGLYCFALHCCKRMMKLWPEVHPIGPSSLASYGLNIYIVKISRAALSNRKMRVTNVNHICYFKFSSSQIKKTKRDGWNKLAYYFTQYIHNIIISKCNQDKNYLWGIFSESTVSMWISYLQNISIQTPYYSMLSRYMWLVAALLDSAAPDLGCIYPFNIYFTSRVYIGFFQQELDINTE